MAEQTLPLHIFALGPPEARLGEGLLTFPARKTLALLIYLAALLWAEASPERSHARLRNTVI